MVDAKSVRTVRSVFCGRFHERSRRRPEEAKQTAGATVVRSGNDARHPRSLPATRCAGSGEQGQRVGKEYGKGTRNSS